MTKNLKINNFSMMNTINKNKMKECKLLKIINKIENKNIKNSNKMIKWKNKKKFKILKKYLKFNKFVLINF